MKCDVTFNETDTLFSKKNFVFEDGEQQSKQSPIVDNCGLKFLLALRSYSYLIRTLPESNRMKLKEIGLGTANFAWAFHSECEHELINSIPQLSEESKDDLTWLDLRQYGVGWWLKNLAILTKLFEKVSKSSLKQKNDPMDAALYLLAMKKKTVLRALFKTVNDTKMFTFFNNDFNDKKWQSSALKKAFVLLGKQRFENAAAFFLLAGRLKDAIEVCVRNLRDLQLALVIVRLYENDFDLASQYVKNILCVEILGYSARPGTTSENNVFGLLSEASQPANISSDPF